MSASLDQLVQVLKKLPGLGARSAERIAIHLLAERPEKLLMLRDALEEAGEKVRRCEVCGNLTEHPICEICTDASRHQTHLCIVESVSDLLAIESSAAWAGVYHVLNGKLSPIKGIGPDALNMNTLVARFEKGEIEEVVLALSNDIEGEATCHYIQQHVIPPTCSARVSRIGFGLPSGGGIPYADATTLRSALDSRRGFS